MKIVQEYEDYQNNLSARGGGGNELKTGGDGWKGDWGDINGPGPGGGGNVGSDVRGEILLSLSISSCLSLNLFNRFLRA